MRHKTPSLIVNTKLLFRTSSSCKILTFLVGSPEILTSLILINEAKLVKALGTN